MTIEEDEEGVEALRCLDREAGNEQDDDALARWRAMSPHSRATTLHAVAILRGEKTGPLNGPPPAIDPSLLINLPEPLREAAANAPPGARRIAFETRLLPLLQEFRKIVDEAGINYGLVLELDTIEVGDEDKELAQIVVSGRFKSPSPPLRRVALLLRDIASDDEPSPIDLLRRLFELRPPGNDDPDDSPS